MAGPTPSPRRQPPARRDTNLLRIAQMYAIRYLPVPWSWKHLAIWLASPKTVPVGVAVIPDSEGRVLLLNARYSGRWLLPGGGCHPNEDPLTGTLRECREELGLTIQIERPTGIYAYEHARELVVAFRAAPLREPPRLSEEHTAYVYLHPHQIRRGLRPIVEDAMAAPGPLQVRTLPGAPQDPLEISRPLPATEPPEGGSHAQQR